MTIKSSFKYRYVVAVLTWFGFFGITSLRTNISVTIVAMVNNTGIFENTTSSTECLAKNRTFQEQQYTGSLNWNTMQQGLVLGCYFYGYVLTGIPGSWLSKWIGFDRVVGVCMLVSAIVTMLCPLAAYFNLGAFVFCRTCIGLLQGTVAPSLAIAFVSWFPPEERNVAFSTCLSGFFMGVFATMLLSGIIIDRMNWESVFYITGSFSLVWSLIWFAFVSSSPKLCRWVTVEERIYIERSNGLLEHSTNEMSKKHERPSTPWCSIFTSLPFCGILFAHFVYDWTFNAAALLLPSYMSSMLNFNVVQSGVSVGIPYIMQAIVAMVGSIASNFLQRKGILSTTLIRKIVVGLALLGPALFIVLACYTGCNTSLTVIYFTLSTGLLGLHVSGTEANIFDLSPKHAGTMFGICGTTTVAGFLAPQVAGYLLYQEESMWQWKKIFFIASALNVLAALFYFIVGSGVEQQWSKDTECDQIQEVGLSNLTPQCENEDEEDNG